MYPTPHKNPFNGFAYIKHKSRQEWHLFWVLEDEDFNRELIILRKLWDKISKYEEENPALEIDDSKNPPSRDPQYNELRNEYDLKWNIVRDSYFITDGDLSAFFISDSEDDKDIDSLTLWGRSLFDAKYIKADENKGLGPQIVLSFNANLTHEDYVNSWKTIKYLLGRKGIKLKNEKRRRAPDDTQLIYAVFKARQKKTTFKDIYKLYQDGNLSGYNNKPTNQFLSEDSLESYFQKYRPGKD